MRLIDADELKDSLGKCKVKGINPKYVQGAQDAIDGYFPQIIDDAPTIDAEPIVRCKNCEFVDTLECPMNYIDHQRLIFSNRSPDWFCAEGVKKDET